MPAEKMHKDEVDTDAASLGRLLANQFPQWADLPIEPVAWSGGERTAEDARVEHVASRCIGEGVVEGVERVAAVDLELEAVVRRPKRAARRVE